MGLFFSSIISQWRAKGIFIRQTGFTLIELSVTLVTIAILAGIAVPGVMSWLPNYRLKAAARDLYSNLQKAKLMAVKTNSEHAVFFNTAAGSYQILSVGNDKIWGTADDIAEKLPIRLASYGSGVRYGHGNATKNATQGATTPFAGNDVSYDNNTVVFSPRGMLKGVGFTGYVYFSNNAGSSYAVGTPTTVGYVVLRKWFAPSANWD